MEYNPPTLFGARLATIRKARGWSQELLALKSGLARSYVGGIERGQRNLSLINICVLAHTLGVPPKDLLDFLPMHAERSDSGTETNRPKI